MWTNRATSVLLKKKSSSSCWLLPNYSIRHCHYHYHYHYRIPSHLHLPKFHYNTCRVSIYFSLPVTPPDYYPPPPPLNLFQQTPNNSQDRIFSDYGAHTNLSLHNSSHNIIPRTNFSWTPSKFGVGLNQIQTPYLLGGGDGAHQQPDDRNASIEQFVEALKALSKLKQQQGNSYSAVFYLPTYHLLIRRCGQLRILEYGRIIHDQLVRSIHKHFIQVTTYNQILDMYSQCGSMSDAYNLFQNMPQRDFKSWDTMISGLAKNGLAEDAILLFTRFKEEGLQPDGQVFLGVFLACGILGDVVEGMLHFESMNKVYGVIPSMEHYASVVNMLGSAGYLDEAMEFIEKMPFEPDIAIWETLMIFCRAHGNMELGNHCAEIVNHLDPFRLRDKLKEECLVLVDAFGKDTREVETKHRLVTCTDGELVNHEVYTILRGMNAHMKELGYVAMKCQVDYFHKNISDEEKEEVLLGHSEKIALATGLMNTRCRTDIKIFKKTCLYEGNVCEDCYEVLKSVSKLVGRKIVMVTSRICKYYEPV